MDTDTGIIALILLRGTSSSSSSSSEICSRELLDGFVRGIDRGTDRERITRSTSTRFTNSSSAATVGEQWPKPCMPSFLDDLGILIRRHEIFDFYYVP